MTSWNWIQPGMPYRCNYVPLASACKSVSLRNAASFAGSSGSCDSNVSHCSSCPHPQPVRPTANLNCLPPRDAMNSTYYHHQCYRRNVWIRGAPSVSTRLTPPSASGGTARPEFFRLNGLQRMTMFGSQPWRALHHSGFNDQNGDSGATAAAAVSSPWNHSCHSQEVQRRQSDIAATDQLRRAVDHVRQWQYTEAGLARLRNQHGHRPHHQQQQSSPRRNEDIEFIVVSYNVLAQCLLEDNLAQLYDGCRSEDLAWENRRQRLIEEFQRTDADVLCLQEVQCDHYESFFVPKLAKLGYKGLYKKRTGDKRDGCAIFFRERVFELDQSASIEYRRKGMPMLNRDNVALVAVLRIRRDDKASAGDDDDDLQGDERRLCVANTHLLFNPKRGDIRLAQIQILFAELDRLAFRGFRRSSPKQQQQLHRSAAYHPIIVCGDMNSRPQCHLYKFIVGGSLKYEGLMAGDVSNSNAKRSSPKRGKMCLEKELVPSQVGITDQCQYRETSESRRRTVPVSDDGDFTDEFSSGQMTHGLCLVSAYGHRLEGDRPEVTTHHDRASCTVDYIFYSVKKKHSLLRDDRVVHERVAEGRLSLLATHMLPSSEELSSFGGLPNNVLPSDHVQLAAKFLLKTK